MARDPVSCLLLIFLFIATLFIGPPSWCSDADNQQASAAFLTETITLRQHTPSMAVETRMACLVESSASTPLNHLDVSSPSSADKWQPCREETLDFGIDPSPFWVRFTVHNTALPATIWLLEVARSSLEPIDVICYDHDSNTWCDIHQTGIVLPATAKRSYGHPVFPLHLSATHHSTIYMRFPATANMRIPLTLWQHDALFTWNNKHLLVFGLFFGTIVALLCYNGSLFFVTRDWNYLLFSCYGLSVLLLSLACSGLGYQYLWSGNSWITVHATGFFSSLSLCLAALFVHQFLSLKKYGGWVLWTNPLLVAFWALACVLFIVRPNAPLLVFWPFAALVSCLIILAIAISLWRKGNVSARYVTIAWIAFVLVALVFVLTLSGRIAYGLVVQYGQMTGFTIEVFLLSLALAERVNREQTERKAAQERMLETQRFNAEKLEQRVHRRTRELERTLASLEEANKELADLTITDALTRIYNRRYFDQAIENEFGRAVRTGEPLSLIMGDLDHFKVINDTHGHRAGDECLKAMAGVLKVPVIRSTDVAARYGGEEFAVILPATDQDSAVQVAERIRLAVEELDIVYADRPIPLRLSLGVAGWIPQTGEQVIALIHAADTALYQAKENGRNQVVAAALPSIYERLQLNY
jgi:diguanylate cyclase